jgi:hypothetical protein
MPLGTIGHGTTTVEVAGELVTISNLARERGMIGRLYLSTQRGKRLSVAVR